MDINRYMTYPVSMFTTPDYEVSTTYKNNPDAVFTEAQLQAAHQDYRLLAATIKDLGFTDLITLEQQNHNRVISSHLSPMSFFYSLYAKYQDELSRSRGEVVRELNYREAIVTLFNFHTQTAIVESLPTKQFLFLTPILATLGTAPIEGTNGYRVQAFCKVLTRLKESLEEELTLHGVACSSSAVNTLLTLKTANCRSLLVRGHETDPGIGSEKYPCGGPTPLDSLPAWFELIADNVKTEDILLLTSHVMNPKYSRTGKLTMTSKEVTELDGIPIEWVIKMICF